MVVVHGHLGVLGSHGLNGTAPQVTGIDEDVVLVDQRQMPGRTPLSLLEGVTHKAFHPVGRVDAHLGGDLVRGARANRSPVAAIEALCTLTHDQEINITGSGQRCGHTRVVLGWTQIDVVI